MHGVSSIVEAFPEGLRTALTKWRRFECSSCRWGGGAAFLSSAYLAAAVFTGVWRVDAVDRKPPVFDRIHSSLSDRGPMTRETRRKWPMPFHNSLVYLRVSAHCVGLSVSILA